MSGTFDPTPVDLDLEVRLAVYRHFVATGGRPTPAQTAAGAATDVPAVLEAYRRLGDQRILVLEPDDASIRMAAPFSGVPTPHVVESGGVSYFANCAWDALGIPAALAKPATIRSRCGQSLDPLRLEVTAKGLQRSDWLFHCLVPAAHWWDDVVFT